MLSDAEEIVSMQEVREDYASTYEYSDGVIEVPQNIDFEISSDETAVTLHSDSVSIEAGDSFVVYLDSLPVAYTALSVARENGQMVIAVEKAEANVFSYVDAQGVIPLSAENSEFIPADDVELMDGLEYSNGKLSLSISIGDSKAEIYLSNLKLNHSFSDSGFTVTVSGSWGLTSNQVYKEESVSEVPLGQIRVFGIGVIAVKLSLSMGMEMSADVSGTFTAGASVLSDGTTRAIHEFSVGNRSVTGQGSITAALKISAGVDILVAQAIVYGEIGFKTQYTSQIKENSNKETVHCQDFKYYLFLTVGADLNYFAFWSGKMEKLTGKEIPLADEKKSPVIWQIHFENGKLVGSCSMGMTVADLDYGGTSVVADDSLSFDGLDRRLETSVTLPCDLTVPDGLTVSNGSSLDLNGHTLTVEGDLIFDGNYLNIGSGTLNVAGRLLLQKGHIYMDGGTVTVGGDLRIQSVTKDAEGKEVYGETNAYLYMHNGSILNVGGDFVTQSTRGNFAGDGSYNNYASDCAINLKGNFSQLDGSFYNFVCEAKVVFCGQSTQNIYFDSPYSSYFANLSFKGKGENIIFSSKIKGWTLTEDLTLHTDMNVLGDLNLNGHTLTVDGNLSGENGNIFFNNGTLTVNGDLIANNKISVGDGTLTVNGNLTSKDSLSINGALNVAGNLLNESGEISIGGTATVGGDFRIQSVTIDENGEAVYGETYAYMRIYGGSVLNVGGDFVTQSAIIDYNRYESGCIINLKGDFTQLAGVSNNFACNGKVVLCGQSTQNIYFETPEYSYFTDLQVKNSYENIVFKSAIHGWRVSEDTTIYQGLETFGEFDLIDENSLTVNGNLISDGGLSIGRGALNVTGSLLLKDGGISISGGTATVGGDFRIQSVTIDENGEAVYGETYAYMRIYGGSVLNVGGDFVTQSAIIDYNRYESGCIINLKGDFTQLAGVSNNFVCKGKVVLCGQSSQNIYFETPEYSYFTDLQVKNSYENIVFNSAIHGWRVSEDTTIYQGLETFGEFELLDENILTVNGDLIADDALDIGNGTLIVKGDLTAKDGLNIINGALNVTGNLLNESGEISIGRGTATVGGDFRIQSVTLDENGEAVYGETYAYMRMNGGSVLNVGGDFVTQSVNTYFGNKYESGCIINLKGDFTQLAGVSNNFACNGKVVLCGQSTQNIYFETPEYSYFTDLQVKNSYENIVFKSAIHGWRVSEDTTIYQGLETFGEFELLDENILTVNGNLISNGGLSIGSGALNVTRSLLLKDGGISINDGTATVGGDFRIQSVTIDENGEEIYGETNAYMRMGSGSVLSIGGDFVTQSSRSTYRYGDYNYYVGTINLKGDFTQLAGVSNNFVCKGKVVLCGTDKQTISFATYPSSKFTTLQLTRPLSSYVFDPDPCWDTLIEAETAAEMTEPVLQTNGSAGTVAAKLTCPRALIGTSATAVAAFYDENGMMIAAWMGDELALQDGMDLEITGELTDGYSTVKLFLLDVPSCAPICKARQVTVDR